MILRFACERRVENGRFCVSLTSEEQKTGDFAFRLRAKSRKRVILRFAHERRAENGRFCVSSADDGQFLLYFSFRRPTTANFYRFLYFVARRQTIFVVFCISSADDRLFLLFSAFRRPTTGGFSRFSIKNRDFFAPNGSFYQKIAIFWLPTANSVKKLRFFCSRRLILSKNCDFFAPDAHFCKNRGRFGFSEGSEAWKFSFSNRLTTHTPPYEPQKHYDPKEERQPLTGLPPRNRNERRRLRSKAFKTSQLPERHKTAHTAISAP